MEDNGKKVQSAGRHPRRGGRKLRQLLSVHFHSKECFARALLLLPPSAAAAGHFHGGEAVPGALREGLRQNPPLLHRLRRGPGARVRHGLGHPRDWGH